MRWSHTVYFIWSDDPGTICLKSGKWGEERDVQMPSLSYQTRTDPSRNLRWCQPQQLSSLLSTSGWPVHVQCTVSRLMEPITHDMVGKRQWMKESTMAFSCRVALAQSHRWQHLLLLSVNYLLAVLRGQFNSIPILFYGPRWVYQLLKIIRLLD
jgi:hypothetical protein